MKNKKVIVTSGSGFTGSNLVDGVLENNEVTIIDVHSTDPPDNIQQGMFILQPRWKEQNG